MHQILSAAKRQTLLPRCTRLYVALDLGARRQELPNDYTFVVVGGESPEEFLRKTGIEIVEKAISL